MPYLTKPGMDYPPKMSGNPHFLSGGSMGSEWFAKLLERVAREWRVIAQAKLLFGSALLLAAIVIWAAAYGAFSWRYGAEIDNLQSTIQLLQTREQQGAGQAASPYYWVPLSTAEIASAREALRGMPGEHVTVGCGDSHCDDLKLSLTDLFNGLDSGWSAEWSMMLIGQPDGITIYTSDKKKWLAVGDAIAKATAGRLTMDVEPMTAGQTDTEIVIGRKP